MCHSPFKCTLKRWLVKDLSRNSKRDAFNVSADMLEKEEYLQEKL